VRDRGSRFGSPRKTPAGPQSPGARQSQQAFKEARPARATIAQTRTFRRSTYLCTVKILFVGPVPPLQGGIAQHSMHVVQALKSAGHTVDVLSWIRQYPGLLYRGSQGLAVGSEHNGAAFDLKWWSAASWLRGRKLALQADLLVFPYVTPFHALAQWTMSIGVPRVTVIVHNATPHERMPLQTILARRALSNANRVVVHGQEVASYLREIGVDADIAEIAMPATLTVPLSPLPIGPPYRLLFFGYVRPYKGVRVAVSAIDRLRKMGVEATLTVLGEFWEPLQEYEKLISELGLQESITLNPGYASDGDVVASLEQHHLVLAPYISNTRSAVVPVAHAAGRPVVGSRVVGLSSQIDEGVNGLLVRPGDPEDLARGIAEALRNIEDLARGAASTSTTWSSVARAVVGPTDCLTRSEGSDG
jgi:glycosyltransferase involved in cell wall biosynthesis